MSVKTGLLILSAYLRGVDFYGLPFFQGIYVTRVTEGGPAEIAGLQIGDKIMQVKPHSRFVPQSDWTSLLNEASLFVFAFKLVIFKIYFFLYLKWPW